MKLYRNFISQEEIDLEYNMALTVPDITYWLKWYSQQSKVTRNNMDCLLDVKYGSTHDEMVDIFPAKNPRSPLLLFIHGGYWVRCSSKDFSFIAEGFVKQGISVAVCNYSHCPKVSISSITQQTMKLISWLYREANSFGADPSKLFVAGHSAGGQQVGMLITSDWKHEYGLPSDVIKGGIPISGVFDLSPLFYSYLQPKLGLTHHTITQQSPLFQITSSEVPLLISVGEKETTEFRRQTDEFFQAWKENGNSAKLWIEKDKHHFSAIENLFDPNSSFTQVIVDFIYHTKPL